jgi:hypothetical protein
VVNIYAEIPVELTLLFQPGQSRKFLENGCGRKSGYTFKNTYQRKEPGKQSGQFYLWPYYIVKESNKRFFNGTMLAVTGRVGYGFFSIDAGYQFNGVLKDGVGASMNKFSVGITISGL